MRRSLHETSTYSTTGLRSGDRSGMYGRGNSPTSRGTGVGGGGSGWSVTRNARQTSRPNRSLRRSKTYATESARVSVRVTRISPKVAARTSAGGASAFSYSATAAFGSRPGV
jgi:hypothetical protein